VVAAEVDGEDGEADEDGGGGDEPHWQVGIDDGVEDAHEKWAAGGCDSGASFEPGFRDGERAERPRKQFDDDGVEKRGDVQRAQKRAAARDGPAEQDPDTPKQVQEEDGFDGKGRCENGVVTSRCRTAL